MKTTFALIALLGLSSPSFALVRELARCETSDKLYTVTVLDNEGIGPVRTAHLGAVIYNAKNEVVGNYAVSSNAGQPKSVSFGQDEYTDTQSNGDAFVLAFGSTNFRHITLKAVLDDGTKVSEVDPVCQNFGN